MDLITMLQLEDAVANRALVDARIACVAEQVAAAQGEWTPRNGKKWRVTGHTIELRPPRAGMEHLEESSVRVEVKVDWEDRPTTPKHGDADDDERDWSEESRGSAEYLCRYITFPYRYLLTDGWQVEVERKAEERAAWFRNYHLPGMRKAVAAQEEKLREMEAKLAQQEAAVGADIDAGLTPAESSHD